MEDILNRRIRKKQLKKKGTYINPTELWNLDNTIAIFVLPRLKTFKKVSNGYPESAGSFDEWMRILDKMIAAFELLAEDVSILEKDKQAVIKEGLQLFADYYQALWW